MDQEQLIRQIMSEVMKSLGNDSVSFAKDLLTEASNLKSSSGNPKQALMSLRLISMNQIFCTVQDSCIIL